MYIANVKNSENADRWLAALYSSMDHGTSILDLDWEQTQDRKVMPFGHYVLSTWA